MHDRNYARTVNENSHELFVRVEHPFICVSGGFDPIHEGHISLIEAAASFGKVIVILNSDDWLMRKKGFVFMKWEARAAILLAMKNVVAVSRVDDSDGTVCEALERLKPTYFANGGDRTDENTPEYKVCKERTIHMIFDIGGEKIASSSELVANARAYEAS